MTGSGPEREVGWPQDGCLPGRAARPNLGGFGSFGDRPPAERNKLHGACWRNSFLASRSRVCRALLLTISILVGLRVACGQAALPSDNLSYPVLITLGNGLTGSGFFLNSGTAIYLVTAKHVLFNPITGALLDSKADLISYSRDPTDSSKNWLALDLLVLLGDGGLKAHPSEDVVVAKVFILSPAKPGAATPFSLSPEFGVTIKEATRLGITGADATRGVKTFDQVIIGNDVVLFGYPTSLALQQLPQLDVHHPLLRKGIVAGTNPATRTLILDCPAYFGNSGGPVVEVDHEGLNTTYKVIGVMNMYVPFVDTGHAFQMASNSGYSIATPMDFVLELASQLEPKH